MDRTAESPITDRIDVPADYREMLNFTCDMRPLVRVSLTRLQSLQVNPTEGWPEVFV